MDRSFAARSGIGRLGRSPGRGRGQSDGGAFAPAAALRAGAERVLRELSAHRRLRLALTCLAVALPLLGGGWMWFRHSSFVSARQVRVSGAGGPERVAVEAALLEAAHGMSTLAPSQSVLMAAVARFPEVSEVRAIPSFPHGMRIVVVEQAPAAVLVASGVKTAVAGDGVVLGPALAGPSLPTVAGGFVPPVGTHLQNPLLLEAMAVLGAAPHTLKGLIARAYVGPRGLTVAMHNGLLVYFGDASRPHAKWLSLARVLADPSSAGASYIDVRLPGRPSAGFGTADTAETPAGPPANAGKASSEATVSALAAGLKAGTPQAATTPAESTTETTPGTAGGEETSSPASSGEASEGASGTTGG